MIDGAMIEIHAPQLGTTAVAEHVMRLTADGPFVFERVDALEPGNHLITFRLRKADTVIGYRNIVELQHRLAYHFDIVGAERRLGRAS